MINNNVRAKKKALSNRQFSERFIPVLCINAAASKRVVGLAAAFYDDAGEDEGYRSSRDK